MLLNLKNITSSKYCLLSCTGCFPKFYRNISHRLVSLGEQTGYEEVISCYQF